MAEEIGFENGRYSNFQGLVTLTLTLDPVIRHTVTISTSTYIPNFIEIEALFVDGRTYVRTDGRTFSPSNIIRSTFGSRPKNLLAIYMKSCAQNFPQIFGFFAIFDSNFAKTVAPSSDENKHIVAHLKGQSLVKKQCKLHQNPPINRDTISVRSILLE